MSLMGGNPSVSSSRTTYLNSSNNGSIFSRFSAAGETSSKAVLCSTSFGSTKNSPWLHTSMSCGFYSFELGISGIRFMTSSRDCAWLIALEGLMNLSWLTVFQVVVADVAPQSCLIDETSWKVRVDSPSLLPPKQDYGLVKVFLSVSMFL